MTTTSSLDPLATSNGALHAQVARLRTTEAPVATATVFATTSKDLARIAQVPRAGDTRFGVVEDAETPRDL